MQARAQTRTEELISHALNKNRVAEIENAKKIACGGQHKQGGLNGRYGLIVSPPDRPFRDLTIPQSCC